MEVLSFNFCAVIILVWGFFLLHWRHCFYLKSHFSPCIWFQFLVYISYTHSTPHVGLGLDNNTGQTLYSYDKSNFLMLKNFTTSTELVCCELTGNEYSKVTNLIWEKNKLEKFCKERLPKNGHSTLSEIQCLLYTWYQKKAQVMNFLFLMFI